MFRTNPLRDAVCFALAFGAAGAASAQTPVAQPAEGEATTLDRVQVTGSRIRSVDIETAQPVVTISRQDIEKQGFQSVADILQNISAVGNPPISRASPLSAGELAGGTYISLRNLGAQRTLVLVNGRRLGISTSGFADVSTIPAVAVERIEILKDGASSIYGSDAIAGVINVITRRNFDGAAANVYYGQYDEGDGSITKGDVILGVGGDRASVVISGEWGKEEAVYARDRDFSAFPRSSYHPTDNWTAVGQFGGFQPLYSQRGLFPNVPLSLYPAPTANNPNPTGPRVVLRDGGNPNNPADYIPQNTSTGACAGNSLAAPGPGTCTPGSTLHKSNTNLQTDLRTPLERRSLSVDGLLNITDNIRFRTEMLYSFRSSERTVAGYPMQAASFNTPMSGQSYFNPIPGQTIANWWRRTWEVPRVSTADLTTYRFVGAFEGNFDAFGQTFDWDVNYLHNSNKLIQNSFGNLNLANTRLAVGPSFLNPATGQVVCGTPDNPATPANDPVIVAGCVPFNPFVNEGIVAPGGLTGNAALQNYLFQEEHATGKTETTSITANLTGVAFELPAGPLGFAVGVENRKENGAFVPDALAVTGGSTNLSSGPTRGGYTVNEIYAEVEVPILADMPFARELTFNAASRLSDYDTFGETTNNKFMLKWKPIESLLIRGTVADGFRAPTISDLYGGSSDTFAFYTDPCDTNVGNAANNATTRANCAAGVGGNGALGGLANTFRQLGQGFVPVTAPNQQTPVAFKQGSNPLLTPEISKSQTIGMVFSPSFISGFNMAIDWWKIRIADTIVADSPGQILTDCYVQAIASRCVPTLFTRDPNLGYVNFMNYGSRNAGYRKTEGFDVDFSYRLKTDSFGTFNFNSNNTYTVNDYLVSTNDPRYPLSGTGFAGSFRIRSNTGVSWQNGSFGASWTARYYSGMKEGCTYFTPTTTAALNQGVQPVTVEHLECNEIKMAPSGLLLADGTPASQLTRRRVVGSNTFHDVQFRWDAPWNAQVAIGANNVFGHVGPVMYTQPAANVSYYGGFDIGRFMYLRYTQKF